MIEEDVAFWKVLRGCDNETNSIIHLIVKHSLKMSLLEILGIYHKQSFPPQNLFLICNERYQRVNDHSNSFFSMRSELKSKTFTSSGWKQTDHILVTFRRIYDLSL